MLIVCPSCATSYQVEEPLLGEQGRSVRCVRCRTVWLATPSVEAVSAGEEAWPAAPVDDPWATAELANETSGNEELTSIGTSLGTSLGDDASALNEETALQWTDPTPEETPAPDTFAGAADPISIADAPSVAPTIGNEATARVSELPTADGPREDIEAFAARRARFEAERNARFRLSSVTAIIVALVALNAALIGWRADVVKIAPQTASLFAAIGLPVNLRDLVFDGLSSTKDTQDGVTVLSVEGNIVNPTSTQVDVPRLRLAVRDQDAHEVYSWTVLPARSVLGPHEVLPFRSRLASPPAEGRDVVVRFFNRHDRIDIRR
jgi:predicted Zn finger-like uncharacterized protein